MDNSERGHEVVTNIYRRPGMKDFKLRKAQWDELGTYFQEELEKVYKEGIESRDGEVEELRDEIAELKESKDE